MKNLYLKKLKKDVKILNIGEFFATSKDEGIATVLGACIATCIYDSETGIGGMNHFLIPGDFKDEEIFLSPVARFGMYAMELLMGELIKLNINRDNIVAKVFGGAEIGGISNKKMADNNIRFIKSFLNMEHIPIKSIDVGGKVPRKVFFFPTSGKVLVKKLDTGIDRIIGIEEKYHKKAKTQI